MSTTMMGTAAYRKAFDEAAGDKAKYFEICRDFPIRHAGTATIMWSQFTREITPRTCICANGGELVRFLKMLPREHEDFKIVTCNSEDVDGTVVMVESNPITKTITIVSGI